MNPICKSNWLCLKWEGSSKSSPLVHINKNWYGPSLSNFKCYSKDKYWKNWKSCHCVVFVTLYQSIVRLISTTIIIFKAAVLWIVRGGCHCSAGLHSFHNVEGRWNHSNPELPSLYMMSTLSCNCAAAPPTSPPIMPSTHPLSLHYKRHSFARSHWPLKFSQSSKPSSVWPNTMLDKRNPSLCFNLFLYCCVGCEALQQSSHNWTAHSCWAFVFRFVVRSRFEESVQSLFLDRPHGSLVFCLWSQADFAADENQLICL